MRRPAHPWHCRFASDIVQLSASGGALGPVASVLAPLSCGGVVQSAVDREERVREPSERPDARSGPPPSRHALSRVVELWTIRNDVLGAMQRRFDQYGDAHWGEVLGPPSHCFRHPDAIAEVLVTHASKFGKRKRNLELLGDGLLLSEGERWRRQRRLIQPGFRHESILRYGRMIEEETAEMLRDWAPGVVVELRSAMMELTLRVVCRALFGQAFRGDARRLAETVARLQTIAVTPPILPDWAPSPLRSWRERLRRRVDREVYAIIDAGEASAGSLLAELRATRDREGGMTRTELRDEVVTLFLAGHETTALALTWTFHLLSRHPEVDAAVFAELGPRAPGRGVPTEAMEALELVRCVLKESMRLYPPAYVLPRRCLEPVTIAGRPIAAGEEAWLWIYHMHHDPRWHHQPERFDPGRFAADGEHARHPRAYAPFGAGSRSCIGRHFADLEMALVVANVLARYRLEPLDDEPIGLRPRVTLAPSRPVRVRLRPR
ncbi:MAG TPA: cytochrome P450 [Polyangiaceae bacterium]|nr:cytochrome P450 [Polyangiaceae bacterium]